MPETKNMSCGETVVLAIDAGGTYFKSALVSCAGEIIPGSSYQAPACSRGTKSAIIKSYEAIIGRGFECARNHGIPVYGIGISTPGPFDYEHGISLMQHKFETIRGVPLRNEIYSSGICPNKLPIVFMHDVHAFLTGEHWIGAIKGIDSAAAVTLGTGLGFGIMKGMRILDNGKGGPAISIFNRSREVGVLEDIVSRRGIIARYRQYSKTSEIEIDVHEIAEQARAGNKHAIKVFRETSEILAEELSGILREYEIEAIVFGGQISKSFDLFEPSFKRYFDSQKIHINALQGQNIEFSTLIGVAQMTWKPSCYLKI